MWLSMCPRPVLWVYMESLHQHVCLDMLIRRTANVTNNNFKENVDKSLTADVTFVG